MIDAATVEAEIAARLHARAISEPSEAERLPITGAAERLPA
jgi:hypothetical protein